MEGEWNDLELTDDMFDLGDDEAAGIPAAGLSSAESANDVAQQVQRNAEVAVRQAHSHDNLTFLPQRELYKGPRSIKVGQAVIVRRHADNSYKGMYLTYEVWRRSSQAKPFERQERISLDLVATGELLTYLHEAEASADVGGGTYVVLPAAEVFENLDTNQKKTFAHLLADIAQSRRVADLLASGQLDSAAVENLAAAAQHVKYKTALADLSNMVSGKVSKAKAGSTSPLNEHDYQKWFEDHTWVFGTEYLRRIDLRSIDPHAAVDFILETADGFFDVLELKTPAAPVLAYDTSHKTWYWSADVTKVIAQAAKYLKAIERNADRIYRDEKVSLVRPRVRVVIGRSQDWTEDQHESFRRLSMTLHAIELMTFDHVMLRAQQLINCYEHHPGLPTALPLATDSDEQ